MLHYLQKTKENQKQRNSKDFTQNFCNKEQIKDKMKNKHNPNDLTHQSHSPLTSSIKPPRHSPCFVMSRVAKRIINPFCHALKLLARLPNMLCILEVAPLTEVVRLKPHAHKKKKPKLNRGSI